MSRLTRDWRPVAAASVVALLTVACATQTTLGGQRSVDSQQSADRVLQPVRAALLSADGKRIVVSGLGGGCTRSLTMSARESATTVRLDVNAVPVDGRCTADAVTTPLSVTLNEPLGARQLRDGASGIAVDVMNGNDLAQIGWLPAGYAAAPIDSIGHPFGWVRTYAALDPGDTNVVAVTEYPGNVTKDTDLGGGAPQAVQVHGASGWPVFLRYRSQTMQGTNPDAAQVWDLIDYGTVVTVTS